MTEALEHPLAARIKKLPEPWRSHFPKTADEAEVWRPWYAHVALSAQVLAVANTRIEGAWAAYIDAVPGVCHWQETALVLERGAKLDEAIACLLFPRFSVLPYAE